MSKSRSFGLERMGVRVTLGALAQLSVIVALTSIPALAQITPDATLGAERSRITPGINVQGLPADLIEGGAVRDTSLFHSFLEFNVNNGQRVYFASPTGIETIFSRVTGNNASTIQGTLGVNGHANLFFLNPNGLIFGPNAKLDINGSFLATTGNSFVFPGGIEFSTTNPQAPPLLSIKVPLGVQYGSQPGNITNAGTLSVGQDLTLAAGTLNLQGQLSAGKNLTLLAQDTVRVRDSATNPFIASAGETLVVQGNQGVDIFALSHPNSGFFSGGDMVLRSANPVGGDAHYWAGGNFRVEKLDGSLGNLSSPHDPIIVSNGDVTLLNYTGGSLHILAGGSVTLGDITITGTDTTANTINPSNSNPTLASLASFSLSDGTPITVQGNVIPTLDVRAGVNLSAARAIPMPDPIIIGSSTSSPTVTPASNASINVMGGIYFSSNNQTNGSNGLVLLTNQFQPNGAVGNIQVNQIGTINAVLNSRQIIIDSRGDFTAKNWLRVDTTTSQRAGDIILRAAGNIALSSLGLSSDALQQGSGGNISLVARSVFLNGLTITTNALGSGNTGNGGSISIKAQDTVSISDSSISSGVNSSTGGNSGDIEIQAGNQVVLNAITLSTNGGVAATGSGGGINISTRTLDIQKATLSTDSTSQLFAPGSISLVGTELASINQSLVTTTGSNSAGGSSKILIEAAQGSALLNQTTVSAKNRGGSGFTSSDTNFAGDIFINARDRITIANDTISTNGYLGRIFVGSSTDDPNVGLQPSTLAIDNSKLTTTNSSIYGTQNTGSIVLRATGSTSITNNSLLSSDTLGTGQGGSIDLKTSSLLMDKSQLDVTTQGQGNAGSVVISATDQVTLQGGSQISSVVGSGQLGQGGDIALQARSLRLTDGSQLLSSTYGQGNAGNISIAAFDSIDLVGSRTAISSGVESTGVGNGGNIVITAPTMAMTDGASIQVSNNSTNAISINPNSQAGQIQIRANTLTLDNKAAITAQTITGNGADIEITAKDLTLRRNSVISTAAGSLQNPGTGGTITLNGNNGSVSAEPTENSDIIANAFGGSGGQIKLRAARIVGFKQQSGLTPQELENLRYNQTSDITVGVDGGLEEIVEDGSANSSEESEEFFAEFVQVSSKLVDPAALIIPACRPGANGVTKGRGEFVNTGRGGLPPSPDDPLTSGTVLTPWVTRDTARASQAAEVVVPPSRTPRTTLVEAQGMVIGSKGEVILTADAPTAIPHQSGFSTQSCP